MTDNNAIYVQAQKDLKAKCSGLQINSQTIITVLRYAMEIVELTTLKGVQQKDMALKLVRDVVNDAPLPADQKSSLQALCVKDGPLSNTVDLVIAGTRGELDINQAVQTAASCAVSCLPLCLSLCKKK